MLYNISIDSRPSGGILVYYAHIRQDSSGFVVRQTVAAHCRAAAGYAEKALAPVGLGQAGYLAGLLHDMGKLKQEFQAYLLEGQGARGSVNHTFAGCRYLLRHFHGDAAASCEDLTAELLAFAVGAHHGLFDCVDRDGHSGFLHRLEADKIGYSESVENFLSQCADSEELANRFHHANQELTPVYGQLGDLAGDSDEEFAFYQGLLARLLLSAVIEGDRRDTGEFMTGTGYPPEPASPGEFWAPYLAHLEGKLRQFSREAPIQRARAEISEKCCARGRGRGGILRLNVPTGAGKTLSALRFALSHARAQGKRRLIFTAPLLTILEQNAAVLREYLGDDSIVLEHHSNVVEPEDTAELDLRELAVDSWHSPVIITTLVQLLNTLFSGKTTAIRRFQSLCHSVIVIDEVQTVPGKMLSLFNLAINFLAEVCGTTVVLCSATQPCLERTAHPLRPVPEDMVPFAEDLWAPFRRTELLDGGRRTLAETADFIRETMAETTSLLVICNKKHQATTLLASLKDAAEVCCHLSAAMCPAHRRQTLDRLYRALAAGTRCLCVATQVMEAGVDISFQRVIRLTAGMDSVVQAAGRCNRNGTEPRSPVYIVTLLDENLSRLEEIRAAKEATLSLLDAYHRNPEAFGSDLSSDAAIHCYYRQLYAKNAQDYRLARERSSLFALLSDNRDFWDDTSPFAGRFMMNQAFRTAGSAFTVFDSNTQDVVVPFGQGAALIEELAGHRMPDVAYLTQWISRAKAYTISLYDYQLRALSGVLAEYAGVKVLPPEYYDPETGFTMTPGALDFLEA